MICIIVSVVILVVLAVYNAVKLGSEHIEVVALYP
jgi:hypothetical protein